MSFDKWLYEGVPYVRMQEEKRMLEKLEEKKRGPNDKGPIQLKKPQDIARLEQIQTRIAAWAASWEQEDSNSDTQQHLTEPLNSFWRLIVRQLCEREYPDLVLDAKRDVEGWNKPLVLSHFRTEEARSNHEDLKKAKQLAEVNSKVGFRRVFKMLSECGKPMVTHNGLFDLLFLYDAFQGPLPETYEEFKRDTHTLFPQLFDTKHLAYVPSFNTMPKHMQTALPQGVMEQDVPEPERFSQTSLGGLFEQLQKEAENSGKVEGIWKEQQQQQADNKEEAPPTTTTQDLLLSPRVVFPSGFEHYADAAAAHEAGYDAYMTAFAFLYMKHHASETDADLSAQANTLPMFRSLFSTRFHGEDLVNPSRRVYYHVTCSTELEEGKRSNRVREMVQQPLEAALPEGTRLQTRSLERGSMFVLVDPDVPGEDVEAALSKVGGALQADSNVTMAWLTFDQWLSQEKQLHSDARPPSQKKRKLESESV